MSLLHIIQPVPLLIGVTVNGKSFAMDSESTEECCVGVPVNVHLTLLNNTNCAISPSWLLVDMCEFLGSRISHDLSGRMIHSGNLLQRTPQLEPGQTYSHHLSFVFFYKGNYQVKFLAYILSTTQQAKQADRKQSTGTQPAEQTDGGKVSQSYIEERVTSPILRGSMSPTSPLGESVLEYCGRFGGPVLAPAKFALSPLGCKLTPATAEVPGPSQQTAACQEGLVSISEVGSLVGGRNSGSGSENVPATEQNVRLSFEPELGQRGRGIRRHLTSYRSMHQRLSHLSKRQILGPVISLQVVESRAPQSYP
jgi:hypothetical protein